MSFENFTVKSQEVIQKALELATSRQNQTIEPAHMLRAMLQVDDNVMPYLLKKLNVNTEAYATQLDRLLDSLPKVSGGEHYLSPNSNKAIQKAKDYAAESQDKYVSIEQLFLGALLSQRPSNPVTAKQWRNRKPAKTRNQTIKEGINCEQSNSR